MAIAGMLMDHSEEIEADLARFYPRDADQLTEWYAGRMSLRRLWVLVSQLPHDSATHEAMVGEEKAAWTTLVELTAQVVDAINQLDWHFRAANSKTTPKKPELTPRPNGLEPKEG
jgi:hypothetical protein